MTPYALVLALLTIGLPFAQGQSPHFEPDYSSTTGYADLAFEDGQAPRVLWKFLSRARLRQNLDVEMATLSDAVVGKDALYFVEGGDPARVFAVDRTNGVPRWRYDHVVAGFNGDPSIDAQHVYFGSSIGVTALRRSDGSFAWHHTIPLGMGEGAPIPINGRLYFSGYDGFSYALDCTNGKVIWKRSLVDDAVKDKAGFEGELARFDGHSARPRGAACDGELFIQSVFDQSRLVAINCNDGSRAWVFQAEGWIGPAATIHEDRVYICSQDKHLYCLNRATGMLEWKFTAPTWLASRVAVHENRVYLPVHRGRIYQLDASTGELLNAFEPSVSGQENYGLVYTFPIVTREHVIVSTGSGRLICFGTKRLQLQWDFLPSPESELFTNPVTDGQNIYVTSRQGGENAGESAIIAMAFSAPGKADTEGAQNSTVLDQTEPEIQTATGSMNSLQQDLAILVQAGEHGPAGLLYYVEATNDLVVVFPRADQPWNVVDQIRHAIANRKQVDENALNEVARAAELKESQANQLRIAHARGTQALLRRVRTLSEVLQSVSWDAYLKDATKSLTPRVVELQQDLSSLDPLASGGSVYEALPDLLTMKQKDVLIDYFLASNHTSFRIFQLSDDQLSAFRELLRECAENPMDLRPDNHQQLFRNLYIANRRRVQNIMSESQYSLFEQIAK